ncbi:putative ATP-dependent RNA helicase DDX4 isoform X2 [Amia ocellicauda]|uniref:putative ATP-dependent RNA helicase DDX4 isoform X2 n=1 Tax=Amia ocellicauda TaxID=2972642 RepID=UPI00346432ED
MDDWEEEAEPVAKTDYSARANGMDSWNSKNQSGGFGSRNDNENKTWNNNNNNDGGFGNRGGFRNAKGNVGDFGNSQGFGKDSGFDSGSEWRGGGRGRGRGGFRQDSGNFSYSDGFRGRRGGFGDRSGGRDGGARGRGHFGGGGFRGGEDGEGGGRGRFGRGGFRGGEDGEGGGGRGRFVGGGFRCGEDGGGGRGRFGRGGSRGGYRGQDEDVLTERVSSNSEKGAEDGGENAGPPRVVYVPPPPPEEEDSIFAHYATGINFDKYDDILVDVSGTNPPQAIVTFEEAGLCDTLNRNVSKSGYVKPTPVQKHGMPIIMAGRDLMACAQTGSGKTAAFLLPILQELMSSGAAASRFSEIQEPEALIVAPTRELINQIYLEARKFSYGTCVRPVVVYGGISTAYTIREVMRGCNVLCGTPGRLLDIIGKGKVGLSKLRYLVLDEADRMLDMGFEPDMRKLVATPGMPPKEDRQTLMFSATYPEDIQRLAAEFLKTDYLFVAVGQIGGACSDVEQTILQVEQYSKRQKLVEVLQATGTERTMVFVETKRKADFIAICLCQENIPTTSIHGDREQREREIALGDFRTGKCPVLVATSVAARGLDIEHVQHVVNFDLPSSIDEYVHRIGRTGRCGNTGKALSFFDPECDTPLARSLVKVLSGAQQTVPAWLEEIAFSAHGTCGYNPRGKVFGSVDTRKTSFMQPEVRTVTREVVEDDNWE